MGNMPIYNAFILKSFLILLFCLLPIVKSFAQDSTQSTPFFQMSGSVTLTADFYNYSATPDSAQKGRRPPSLYRLLFSPVLKFGDLLSLPFNIILTTPETNTTTPSVSKPSLAQFLENPANSLGFSSITPKIGWAEFYLGSHSPSYSALSAGDQQLFGAGFNLKPGNFQLAASLGTAQRAIEPDTTKNIRGSYRRDIYMGRVAFGNPDAAFIGINFVRAKDAQNSLTNTITTITPAHPLASDPTVIVPADTARLRAEEGYVASLDGKITFTEGMSFNGEISLSSFTRDLSSPEKAISGNPLAFAQTTRTSTRADIAGSAALKLQKKVWGITLSSLYVGAGFAPIGYTFMQSDRLEFKIAPNLHLFDNKFSITGSLGERVNNLSQTKGETMTQLIGSANMNADISEAFNLSAQYSNFGIRNDQTLDTLKIQNVSQSLSIDPTLTLQGTSVTHIISASFAIDEFKDYNVVSGAESSNDTRTVLGSYTLSLTSIPLTTNILASYMENRLSTGTLIIRSIGTTIGYSFFDRKLIPSFSVTASGSTLGAAPTDDQIFFKFGLKWRPAKMIDVMGSIGNNSYTYGNPIPKGSAFKETLIQLAITTQF